MTPQIELKQTAGLYIGRSKLDRWKWAVCIDGELDKIQYAVYQLHKSQPKQRVKIDTPQTKFTVSGVANGWFTVKCRVRLTTGAELDLEPLKLQLWYPDHVETVVRDS